VGLQWGDEGKAKILDALAGEADIIVRYQGGSNAGHTVIVGRERYAFHLIPAGIVRYGKVCVIANGVVVDPTLLVKEIGKLTRRGISFAGRLKISDRAHLVMPYHRLLEGFSENGLSGGVKLGTTRRGIGPCYSDKMARVGLRVKDLYHRALFDERLAARVGQINQVLAKMYRAAPVRKMLKEINAALGWRCGDTRLDEGAIRRRYRGYARKLEPYLTDTVEYLNVALDRGKRVLFEGAQASMLDIDFGTYPYVTSSNSTSCGVTSGTGVAPTRIDRALGILKAYTTRVGAGPFPTELTDETGQRLRDVGGEYGTTTGRPRRCGWLDLVAARFAVQINDIQTIAVTKLDVLSGLETVKICNAYRHRGKKITRFPSDIQTLEDSTPVYEEFPGWDEDIAACRTRGELPRKARRYLDRIAEILGVKIHIVSVGSSREMTIFFRGGRRALRGPRT
jgi:adenylosuccinate synthase